MAVDHILGNRDTIFHTKGAPGTIDGRRFYTLYNEQTGNVDIKEATWGGNITDRYIGYYDKEKKFHWGGTSNDQDEVDFFKSPEGTNQSLKAATVSSKKDLQTNGSAGTRGVRVSEAEATTLTKNISTPNTGSNDENNENSSPIYQSPTMTGTNKNFNPATPLIYPLGIEKNGQDTLKIDMMEYRARDLQNKQGALGPGDRRIGTPIGSVILPIPGNIKDSDKVNWGEDSMNAGELALAAFGVGFIKEGTAGAQSELGKIMGGLKNLNKENVHDAISNMMAGAAIGKDSGKLMSRASGQVMNPNMELLFNGPSLRDFSFTFLLAPRSKDEAMNVIKIIRFFKQGMAAIRSKSNLFLKAPHTFQLKYNYKNEEEHKYLNSFKECALKSCDVNYTPENSYSTYEDGVMTAYSLTLAFSELEPIYNDDYGTENAENLNFAAGATQATTGTDPATPTTTTPTTTAPSGQGAGPMASDMKLKENINKVGNSPSGINIYEWNYIGKPQRYRGVIAQEIMEVIPKAVTTMENGFLGVYYNLIDVNMELV